MRKKLPPAGFVVVCVLLVMGGSFLLLYRATKQVPDFYRAALLQEPELLEVAGDELERQVLQLHNDVRDEGAWEAVFTDEQINGWLAVDLPRKYPGLVPSSVQQPVVDIETDRIRMGFRVERPNLSTVISLTLDIFLTEEPNQVGVRVVSASAGLLPVPLNSVLDRISATAEKAGLRVQWSQTEGDPVAVVDLPDFSDRDHRILNLENLELREGELYVSGRTRRSDSFLDWLQEIEP